jgi:hypothetical protein
MRNPVSIRCIWLTSLSLCLFLYSFAQGDPSASEPAEPGLSLIPLYTSNDTVLVTTTISLRKGREWLNLQNAVISFSVSDGKNIVRKIGEGSSDSAGTVTLAIPLYPPLPQDAQGMIRYVADFAGAAGYAPVSESFSSKPAWLKVSFYEEDSIRYIRITGTQHSRDNKMAPIPGETVNLFVPSLFRPLPIGEISLDDQGTGTMEFPSSLIGDSLGNITVIARIDEHELFGFVTGQAQINWAIPKHLLAQEKPTRELWTPVAPIWMIITLLIMLTGVWAHYIYAIVQLVRIKTSKKEEKLPETDWSKYS